MKLSIILPALATMVFFSATTSNGAATDVFVSNNFLTDEQDDNPSSWHAPYQPTKQEQVRSTSS
jgi:hypothetical protein